jgi:NitT/TauT family transport system ATP-binding protein
VNGKPAPRARADHDYGIVFQDSVLFDWRTVAKNVALPLEMLGLGPREAQGRAWTRCSARRARRLRRHHPWQLSGGMQMRVAIARALPSSRRCCSWTSRSARSTR